uniref:Uncharacterized protein n=1 Tax=Timema shepardi TaxID=629360 RepID=A0A7R9G2K7_TIMSH|nr:unnamed protein product [Timema shepardi]
MHVFLTFKYIVLAACNGSGILEITKMFPCVVQCLMRKKKCIRYMEAGESMDECNQSEMGSCGSTGEANTPPDDDQESLPHSLSSPGGLSGLSSLTSPSMILPSPSTSLASPSVSLASPCMSLQSPMESGPLTPSGLSPHPHPLPPLPRLPVGTNPHDINNPLSVNQLTGQCIKTEPGVSENKDSSANNRTVISVT